MFLRISLIIVFFIGLPLMAADDSTKKLTITPDNTVILDNSKNAGVYLQRYLAKFLGGGKEATFPLLREKADTAIDEEKVILAVGKTRFLMPEDQERLEKSPGAILLKRQGNVIVIAGTPFGDPWQGNFTAISEFLTTVAGIRFYAPGDLWVSHPKDGQFEIGQLDLFRKQYFPSSQVSPPANPRNEEWIRMNQNGKRMTINTTHNLAHIFPPKEYGETHPQIYEMRHGKHVIPVNEGRIKAWQPSLVAPELPELTMKYIREQMKATPERKYISLGMMDVHFNDESPAAQESVRKRGNYSMLYWSYVNEVARRAAKEFPGLYITGFSYVNAGGVPKGLRFEPNVAVKYVTKSYRYQEGNVFDSETRAMKAFSDAGAKFLIHDWSFGGVSPRSYTRSLARFLQWGAAHGMIGTYFEWSDGQNWYLDGPRYWMLMRLISDPFADVNQLLKTYCDDMYGAGSEAMFQFFSHFEDKYAYAHETIELMDFPRQEFALYGPDDLRYQHDLLKRARALTLADPQIQQRLDLVDRYWLAHQKFAEATYEPVKRRAEFRRSGQQGLNRELLKFYATDDRSRLRDALDYYRTKRTIPPDIPSRGEILRAMDIAYTATYSQPLAEQLRVIRTLSTQEVPEGAADRTKALNNASARILREALPGVPAHQVKELERLISKNLEVPVSSSGPELDGDLSDPVWREAAILDGFTVMNVLDTPVEATRARMLRFGDHLYLGIECEQKGGEIWAATSKDTPAGTRIWAESGVEAIFGPVNGPEGKAPPFAQYVVNANGAFRGFVEAADQREGVAVASRLDKANGRFVIEVRLPLKGPMYDYSKLRELSFTLIRNVFYKDSYSSVETSAWNPMFLTGRSIESRGTLYFSGDSSK